MLEEVGTAVHAGEYKGSLDVGMWLELEGCIVSVHLRGGEYVDVLVCFETDRLFCT